MSILNHCKLAPRPVQASILQEIEKKWNSTDIFVVVAPVALGKSLIADTIAQWQKAQGKGTSIITPDNNLVKQYLEKHDLHTVRLQNSYPTPAAYHLTKMKLRGNASILNYYSYMANRPFGYNNTLVVDEAHHLIDHLKSTTKLWKHLYNMPEYIYTASELLEWIHRSKGKHNLTRQATLNKVATLIEGAPHRYVIEDDIEPYKGQQRELLRIIDLIPRDNPPIYWPSSVKKIVLMSATFSPEDLYDLGLDRRRVTWIDAPSPIPAENRPIYFRKLHDMSYKNMAAGAEATSSWAQKMIKLRPGEKGMLHTTYAMSRVLHRYLGSHPNFIFHTQWNKQEQLQKWLTSDPREGKVLVGCGLTTGLSLDDDRARWQAIVNLPFSNISDRAVRSLLEHRPETYYWKTIRHVLQASGRTTRSPTDWSDTFILDSRFAKLYKEHPHLFPVWFKESYQGVI